MFTKVRSRLSFANVVALIALFVALGGSAYAALRVGSKQIINNSVRSKDIRNGHVRTRDLKNNDVRSGDLRDNTVRNEDANAELALAKGFASIKATNANGPADVLNFGGQQTEGVTAERVGTGIYDVTFNANAGEFTNVDNVDDLTSQVTGRNGFSDGSIFDAASSADAQQVKLRVFMRRPNNGALIDANFSLQFYTGATP